MRIERDGDGVVVRTKRGAVRAKTVIIATGYATREFKPLVGRFRMMQTYVLATARLRRSVRQRIGLTGVMLWDTGKPYHYVRWTPDGRLLLGGADRPRLPPGRRRPAIVHAGASLRKYFARLYPMLASIEAAFLWEGLFAMTPDGLPYIGAHRRYPNHFFALGYGGNGMTFGFLAARLLLEQYRGIRSSDHDLFAFARTRRRRAARRA
jgi:glycine/D-amino acid oxidase-like deaminating enzyme